MEFIPFSLAKSHRSLSYSTTSRKGGKSMESPFIVLLDDDEEEDMETDVSLRSQFDHCRESSRNNHHEELSSPEEKVEEDEQPSHSGREDSESGEIEVIDDENSGYHNIRSNENPRSEGAEHIPSVHRYKAGVEVEVEIFEMEGEEEPVSQAEIRRQWEEAAMKRRLEKVCQTPLDAHNMDNLHGSLRFSGSGTKHSPVKIKRQNHWNEKKSNNPPFREPLFGDGKATTNESSQFETDREVPSIPSNEAESHPVWGKKCRFNLMGSTSYSDQVPCEPKSVHNETLVASDGGNVVSDSERGPLRQKTTSFTPEDKGESVPQNQIPVPHPFPDNDSIHHEIFLVRVDPNSVPHDKLPVGADSESEHRKKDLLRRDEESVLQKEEEKLSTNSVSTIDGSEALIGQREAMKGSEEYRKAEEEEWEQRHDALRKQALEAQKQKKRKKAEQEMEARQKQRLEEMRARQQQEEFDMEARNKVRGKVQKRLEKMAATCPDMATLFTRLELNSEWDSSATVDQVQAAYKKALLKYHPDRVAKFANGNPLRQVEAEETFKIISRLKSILPWVVTPVPMHHHRLYGSHY